MNFFERTFLNDNDESFSTILKKNVNIDTEENVMYVNANINYLSLKE